MNHTQINGTDFHNFPQQAEVNNSLFWMGENYLGQLLNDFTVQLRKQDPATEILAIKSEAEPKFTHAVSTADGTVHGVTVEFKLQILVKSGNGEHWRLRGNCIYSGKALHTDNSEMNMDFDLESAEAV